MRGNKDLRDKMLYAEESSLEKLSKYEVMIVIKIRKENKEKGSTP